MCGIIGGFGVINESTQCALKNISHRGPDDTGIFDTSNIFLGHARLSIQDLSDEGHQPMASDDGRYHLIFNGEIYNHFELRKKLSRQADEFSSTSDTETLLYGLIESGPDFIKLLNGIFAFAFYDSIQHELVIARDQFGIKPLYYFSYDHAFFFCSELKGLLPFLKAASLNHDGLSDYLSFLWCPGAGTPLNEVKKVLPGHYAILSQDPQTTTVAQVWSQYYMIPFNGHYSGKKEEDLVDLLDEKLQNAVKRQLLSDVPVGFFLSGGLDSSLLVAIARKLKGEKLPCFTIDTNVDSQEEGFENDLHYARRVAGHLDVELEVVKADIDIVRDFDFMIWHLDEPQADAAPLNVSNISRRAREMGYKVLIGGTAGDDLFSGYRRHQAIRLEKLFSLVPPSFLKLISNVRLPSKNALFRRINKVTRELGRKPGERLSNYFLWLSKDRVDLLLDTEKKQSTSQHNSTNYLLNLLNDIPDEHSWLNRMLYWEMRSFLVDHNLNYTDKMGMAHGVEIRVPFLDLELVKVATAIPPELKLRGKETKYILKKVAERYLPKDVIYRSKTGFGAPVRKWVLNDLNDMIENRLLTASQYNAVFNMKEVQRLITENRAGTIDASYSIWGLLAIESWIRQFMFRN
jgi:asparagine synthase (glutamine-hydrolysing)